MYCHSVSVKCGCGGGGAGGVVPSHWVEVRGLKRAEHNQKLVAIFLRDSISYVM